MRCTRKTCPRRSSRAFAPRKRGEKSIPRFRSVTREISRIIWFWIRQAIIEFRPRLVVIDPIQAYLGSDSDLQIAGRARKLMRRLGMWAAGYDCAIVLIGHLNKKEGSKGLYRSLGSIDVVAAARSVLQVERDTENPDIRIVHCRPSDEHV